MKKKLSAKEIIVALLIALAITLLFIPHEQTYKMPVFVSGVTGEVVTVVDKNGNAWRFHGEGYHVNDALLLTMSDNGTAGAPSDDMIIEVAYM